MAEKTITERFKFSGGNVRVPGVDGYTGAYPLIEDVLLCGPVSLNDRDYPPAAFQADSKLYEGRPIYVDHAEGQRSRRYEEKLGWIENERRRPDGMPIGNIGINPEHPMAKSVLWAAKHKPDFAGFSHVARCDSTTNPATGRESIRKVLEVESTDLVVDPATTKGFFESKGKPMPKITLKVLCERIGPKLGPKKWGSFQKLLEMEGIPAVEVPEPAADEAPETSLADAFKVLVAAIMDDALEGKVTPEDAGAKVTEFLKTHLGNEEEGEGDDEEAAAAESARKKKGGNTLTEALDVCEKIGFRATREELEIVGSVSAERREQIAKRLKIASEGAAGAPSSSGRAGLTTGTQTKESVVPSDLSKVEW